MDQQDLVKNKVLVIDNAKNQRGLYKLILEVTDYEVARAHDNDDR